MYSLAFSRYARRSSSENRSSKDSKGISIKPHLGGKLISHFRASLKRAIISGTQSEQTESSPIVRMVCCCSVRSSRQIAHSYDVNGMVGMIVLTVVLVVVEEEGVLV